MKFRRRAIPFINKLIPEVVNDELIELGNRPLTDTVHPNKIVLFVEINCDIDFKRYLILIFLQHFVILFDTTLVLFVFFVVHG